MKRPRLWQILLGIFFGLLLTGAGGLFILNRVLFHPLPTGKVAGNVFTVRSGVANMFLYCIRVNPRLCPHCTPHVRLRGQGSAPGPALTP